jgi:nucleosome binding factor SPN SPT16 subunit
VPLASYLEPLKGGKVPVEILVRGKDPEENKKQFQTCLETIKAAGKKIAVLKKDHATGSFADEWKAAFQEAGFKDDEQVDLGPILSQAALSVKDGKELVCITCLLSAYLANGTSASFATHLELRAPLCPTTLSRKCPISSTPRRKSHTKPLETK